MKIIILVLTFALSYSVMASPCEERKSTMEHAKCVISQNKDFISSINSGVYSLTIFQRIKSCKYLSAKADYCGSHSNEICIHIPVTHRLVKKYNNLYKDVKLDGYSLIFRKAKLICPKQVL